MLSAVRNLVPTPSPRTENKVSLPNELRVFRKIRCSFSLERRVGTRAPAVVQLVEHLPVIREVLNSNHRT